MKRWLYVMVAFIMLLAFQCGDEIGEEYLTDQFRGEISNTPVISISDTLWLTGEASAYAVGEESGDSILLEYQMLSNSIRLIRLKRPDSGFNADCAVADFEMIPLSGEIYESRCKFSQYSYCADLNVDSTKFIMKLGIKPMKPGYYLLRVSSMELLNPLINLHLFTGNFRFNDDPLLVQWKKCERTHHLDLRNQKGMYFFRVVEG